MINLHFKLKKDIEILYNWSNSKKDQVGRFLNLQENKFILEKKIKF